MPSVASLHLFSRQAALRSSLCLLSPSPSSSFHAHLLAASLPFLRALGGPKPCLWRRHWGKEQAMGGSSRLPAFQWSLARAAMQVRATGGEGRGGGGDGHGGGGDSGGGSSSDHNSDEGSQHSGFFAWYLKMLERHPVKTKALTSALLNFLGDLFCQLIVEKSNEINLKRISMITVIGLLLVGPTLHFWYSALSRIVTVGGTKGAGMRLLFDQFLFAPVFIAVFFAALLTLEGRPSDIAPKLHQDWRSAVIANWKTWIPFQFLNFLFVPQQLQVGAANLIALAWNVYLSFATHTDVSPPIHKDSKSHEE